jgi:hypothetical protein
MSTQARCLVCKKPLTSGDIGGTCSAHQGKIRLFANTATIVPEGFLKMSVVCRAYEKAGFTTRQIVKACGGDACTEQPFGGEDPKGLFYVTYVGNRKYLAPAILTTGMEQFKKATAAPAEAPKALVSGKDNGKEVNAIAVALQTKVIKAPVSVK